MNSIENLVRLSQFYADRLDMNQAGGGNTSVKEGDVLYIKGSGVNLSEVRMQSGYTAVVLSQVKEILKQESLDESGAQERISTANIGTMRPSIETYLHALLDGKYVLHLHTWVSMLYASSAEFSDDRAADVDDGILRVEYAKPGFELAKAMKRQMDRFERQHGYVPNWIVLQNHGIIGSGDNVDSILEGLLDVHTKLLRRMNRPLNLFDKYCDQSKLKNAFNKRFETPSLFIRTSEDLSLENLFGGGASRPMHAFFPDAVVYCGSEPVSLEAIEESGEPVMTPVDQYLETYGELPKVIFFNGHVFFLGETLKKCAEAEDVFKAQSFLSRQLQDNGTELSDAQVKELLSWEAEKYRRRQ